ncbi:MAG: hypothetical protein MHMPM18_004834 [Marteilia pararefringens]
MCEFELNKNNLYFISFVNLSSINSTCICCTTFLIVHLTQTRYEDWQNRKLEDEYFERIFQDFEEFIQNSLQNDCKNQLPI